MRVLVTGAAGFIGSTLVKALLRNGHEVVGIDSMSDYYELAIKRRNVASIPTRHFAFVPADLNEVDLDQLLLGVDWVFHQAGQPGVRKSWGEDFSIYVRHNIQATQRLLEAARRAPRLKRLVYASSSSVYGNAETYPTAETARPHPVSPYGVTKLAAEHLCSLYASNFGVPTTALRYFTVYGPGQRTDMAFTRFARAAVLNEVIHIYGTGEQIRDFTFVDDIVAANIAAASTETEPGSVFNVAGGSNVSVNQTLAVIEDLNGRSLKINYQDSVAGDVFRTGGDTTKIEAALGWRPTVGIEEGLERQLSWARQTFGWDS